MAAKSKPFHAAATSSSFVPSWPVMCSPQGQVLQVKQYRRLEGVLDLPANAVVKTVTARVLDGATVRATQSLVLD